MKEKFVCNCEDLCPVCGTNNLLWRNSERFDNNVIAYDYKCGNCGAEGTEFYTMTFDGHSVYLDDENVDVNDYINVNEKREVNKVNNMEWYVLNYDFNKRKVELFNIFKNIKFVEGINNLFDQFITFEDFKEKLIQEIKYCFWSKREYEISVGDLWCKENEMEKWDVSIQLIPNIDALARYIIDCRNRAD
jgi:predicted RNA-binding Zn-ribbon protein involved in translation (DUF1610 family)